MDTKYCIYQKPLILCLFEGRPDQNENPIIRYEWILMGRDQNPEEIFKRYIRDSGNEQQLR